MTRDEVLAMKPGRELDVLAGTEIMGWEYIPASSPSAGLIVQDHFFDPKTGDALFGWSPSTDISAAWEVAEKMSEEWPQFSIARVDTGWCVMWGFDGYGWPDVTAATAPEAICKAALLAVMGGEDEHGD